MAGPEMHPLLGFLTPHKQAFGNWLAAWFGSHFRPDTPAAKEWAARASNKAMAWAPGRMVDAAEQMLASWRTNVNATQASIDAGEAIPSMAFLPVLLAAMANDYTESPAEAGPPLTDPLPVILPGDTQERIFRVQTMSNDIRFQVVAVANDPLTANSMMMQLAFHARRFNTIKATYSFGGIATEWPGVIQGLDRLAIGAPTEGLTILALDFTVRATVPMFTGAGGTPGNEAGEPKVQQINTIVNPTLQTADEAWPEMFRRGGAASRGGLATVVLHEDRDAIP